MKTFLGFSYHWQNLDERPHGADRETLTEDIPLHGRAWLKRDVRLPDGRETLRDVGHVEWSLLKMRHIGASFTLDGSDSDVEMFFGVPGMALWLSARAGWVGRVLAATGARSFDNRRFAFSLHDDGVWWEIWRDKWGGWSRDVPRWRQGVFHPLDALLGRMEHSSRLLHEQTVDVPLPEMTYRAKVTLSEASWKRARWPFARRHVIAHIDVPGGIPTDHKGPLFGLSTAADSIADAVGKLVSTVLETRAPNHPTAWMVKPREAAGASE